MSKVIVIARRVFACPNDFMGSRQSNLVPDEGDCFVARFARPRDDSQLRKISYLFSVVGAGFLRRTRR